MRTRLFAATLALSTAAVLAGGATYARYNDAETAKTQSMVSGTFSVDTVNPVGANFPITIDNARPASVWSVLAGGTKQVVVRNTGSLPGTLSVDVDAIVDAENVCLDPEVESGDTTCDDAPSGGELSSQQLITVRASAAHHFVGGFGPFHYDFWTCDPVLPGNTFQTVANAANSGAFSFGSLAAGEARCLTTFTYLPDQSDNNLVQSDSLQFDIAMHLDQL